MKNTIKRLSVAVLSLTILALALVAAPKAEAAAQTTAAGQTTASANAAKISIPKKVSMKLGATKTIKITNKGYKLARVYVGSLGSDNCFKVKSSTNKAIKLKALVTGTYKMEIVADVIKGKKEVSLRLKTTVSVTSTSKKSNKYGIFNASSGKLLYSWYQAIAKGYVKEFKENGLITCTRNMNDSEFLMKMPDYELRIPPTIQKISWIGYYKNVVIPKSVTTIGPRAFVNANFTAITIPDSVKEIGDEAFSNCRYLESIKIPNSVKKLGKGLFHLCQSLKTAEFPKNVKTIKENTFYQCGALESFKIPAGVTSIGDSAFRECGALTGVTIPDSVTSLGRYAFACCFGLDGLRVPSSVTSIGYGAFDSIDTIYYNGSATGADWGAYNVVPG
ncbi:MAG: leucine-rich repeat domain-containing protein [Eubacterium sp.]|nr:leucine-rich repeat domain-containing protein [Eubacterium sp.]